ncbi:MAG: T9SS type A sorting domain-containing protein, partial [Bacteroidales bacterium]|nr:T9SS type A sorting domain-containing protein [Bacteroidales bacterium]
IYIPQACTLTNATVIDGFTIQNGYNSSKGPGGGIADFCGITIRNNIIKNNFASGVGGGLHLAVGTPFVFNNLIINNTSNDAGGGIYIFCGAEIRNNTIVGNTATGTGGGGIGIVLAGGTKTIEDNIIVNNSAEGSGEGGGGIMVFWSTCSLDYNDVWGNTPNNYAGCSAGTNSISADPVFVVSNNQDYFLDQITSPCKDAGSQTALAAGLDNYTTSYKLILDGNQVDIGYHYNPSFTYYNTQWTGIAKSNVWHDAGNWDTGVPGAFANVTIPAGLTNYPTISAATECNNISFGSNSTNTATLLDNGYLTVNGTATVERYFTGNDTDWHLVSAPISNALSGVFTGMYLQSFSEGTNSYTEIIQDDVPLGIMEGYGLYSNLAATNTVSFVGALNFGTQNHGYDSTHTGWNLLGNPYVSSIDWDLVTIPATLNGEVHYIEASTGNDLFYNSGGTGSQYIAPMQGFFVKAKPTAPGTLSFNDAVRTHLGANNFYKSDDPQLLILDASGENYSDQTWIRFNEEANIEHDGSYDAYKRISLSNAELPQIFSTTASGVKLGLNTLPETSMVPVGFTAVESGVFTISAVETGEFANVVLEDLFTQTQTDLLKNSYTFNYTAGDQENRFIVHFTPMSVPETFEEMVNIFSFNTDVYVTVPVNTKGNIFIYNMMGQEVTSAPINNTLNKITLEKSAYYIVKVLSDKSVVTKKIFIK